MAKNSKKPKENKLPVSSKENFNKQSSFKLPTGDLINKDANVSFSFACFDRKHKLFNLSGKTASVTWFYDLLEALKEVSKLKISQLKNHSRYQMHRVNWLNANTSIPKNLEQNDFYQFRINKAKGRIIGFILGNIFYIVWIDAEHNLTNIDGYGKEVLFNYQLSEYEELVKLNEELNKKLQVYEEIFENT